MVMLTVARYRLIPDGLLPYIERSTLDNLMGAIASSMLGVVAFSLSILGGSVFLSCSGRIAARHPAGGR